MKHILAISLFLTTASLSAQTFEWTSKEKATAAHPKEVQAAAQLAADRQTGLAGVYTSEAEGTQTAYGETYDGTKMTGSHGALPLGTLLRVTNTENGKTVVVRVTDRGKECVDCLITLSAVAAEELGIDSPSPVSLERSGFSNWNPAPGAPAPVTYAPATLKAVTPAPTTLEEVPSPAKPSVITREVDPAPATYNRYPEVARPSAALTTADQAPVTPPSPTVPGRQEARGGSIATPAAASPVAEEGEYSIQLAAYSNEAYALRRVNELKEQGITDAYYRAVTKPDGEVINRVYSGTFASVTDAQDAARVIQGKFNIAGIVAKM